MAEFKNFIVGLIITVGLMGLFGYFITGAFQYNSEVLPASFNSTLQLMGERSTLESSLSNITAKVNKATGTASEYSLFDIIGFWFQQGWSTLKLALGSLNIMGSMVESSSATLQGTFLGPVVQFITFIILNIVVIGIILLFLSILLKWEL